MILVCTNHHQYPQHSNQRLQAKRNRNSEDDEERKVDVEKIRFNAHDKYRERYHAADTEKVVEKPPEVD